MGGLLTGLEVADRGRGWWVGLVGAGSGGGGAMQPSCSN